ncbi:Hypothetical predicted protein [Podarcis lilfordi]|uniref:Uncharacterized protein n=1 Tax=Podarcis lilfordi TaxID=74358 RepID=A0AA35JVM9_9SAUR|nr:Hypothetical predicted protein [Podarcis lilfordi]
MAAPSSTISYRELHSIEETAGSIGGLTTPHRILWKPSCLLCTPGWISAPESSSKKQPLLGITQSAQNFTTTMSGTPSGSSSKLGGHLGEAGALPAAALSPNITICDFVKPPIINKLPLLHSQSQNLSFHASLK